MSTVQTLVLAAYIVGVIVASAAIYRCNREVADDYDYFDPLIGPVGRQRVPYLAALMWPAITAIIVVLVGPSLVLGLVGRVLFLVAHRGRA